MPELLQNFAYCLVYLAKLSGKAKGRNYRAKFTCLQAPWQDREYEYFIWDHMKGSAAIVLPTHNEPNLYILFNVSGENDKCCSVGADVIIRKPPCPYGS